MAKEIIKYFSKARDIYLNRRFKSQNVRFRQQKSAPRCREALFYKYRFTVETQNIVSLQLGFLFNDCLYSLCSFDCYNYNS